MMSQICEYTKNTITTLSKDELMAYELYFNKAVI